MARLYTQESCNVTSTRPPLDCRARPARLPPLSSSPKTGYFASAGAVASGTSNTSRRYATYDGS